MTSPYEAAKEMHRRRQVEATRDAQPKNACPGCGILAGAHLEHCPALAGSPSLNYGLAAAQETAALLDEREKTHGSFAKNSYYGQTLRDIFRNSDGWQLATPRTREALDYVAGKLSRILSGQPNEKQHWEDIAGYAELVFSDAQR